MSGMWPRLGAALAVVAAFAAGPAVAQNAPTLDMRAMRFGGDIYLTVGGATPDGGYGDETRLLVALDQGASECTTEPARVYEGANSESVYDSDLARETVESEFFMYLETTQTGTGTWRACALLQKPSGTISKTLFVQMPQRCSGATQRIIGGRRGQFVRLTLTGTTGVGCAEGRQVIRSLIQHWGKHRNGPLLEQRSRGENAGFMYFYGPTPLRGYDGASVIYNRLGSDVGRFSVALPGQGHTVDVSEYHAPTSVYLASCRTRAQRRSTTCR